MLIFVHVTLIRHAIAATPASHDGAARRERHKEALPWRRCCHAKALMLRRYMRYMAICRVRRGATGYRDMMLLYKIMAAAAAAYATRATLDFTSAIWSIFRQRREERLRCYIRLAIEYCYIFIRSAIHADIGYIIIAVSAKRRRYSATYSATPCCYRPLSRHNHFASNATLPSLRHAVYYLLSAWLRI